MVVIILSYYWVLLREKKGAIYGCTYSLHHIFIVFLLYVGHIQAAQF